MLQSGKPYHGGPLRQWAGLAFIALSAGVIWWLLNMAFPEQMRVLIQAVKAVF